MSSGQIFGWLPGALGAIAHGAGTTLFLIACTTVLGIGLSIAGAAARRSRHRILRGAIGVYVEVIRNTPFLVQLFFIFFGLPSIGVHLSEMTAATLAMVINLGAYSCEIV